jgi:hypothetical protein
MFDEDAPCDGLLHPVPAAGRRHSACHGTTNTATERAGTVKAPVLP